MELYHLKLKTQKVQGFIFKVPKLKAMLGANSLLGELFAKDLPVLRVEYDNVPITSKNGNQSSPKAIYDNIYANFKNGVICSAGGHFESVFKAKDNAINFLKATIEMANDKIPGVDLSYFLRKFQDDYSFKKFESKNQIDKIDVSEEISNALPLIDSPYFYPSIEDGENPINEKKATSEIVDKIQKQGNKFYGLATEDYLRYVIGDILNEINCKKENLPIDLKDIKNASLIPNNNKMAVIAIDGNAMGQRFIDKRDKLKKNLNIMDAFIDIEEFWFDARETFRRALKNAIFNLTNIKSYVKGDKKLPFMVLMLGGDDLLLLTVPELAFGFVHSFKEELSKTDNPITFSAGIAFVKYNYPFVHAHELAESLLSSAKFKSRENKDLSDAVDWHIQFSSMYDDIEKIRLSEYYLQYQDGDCKTIREILTKRPYLIDGAGEIYQKSKKIHDSFKDDENIGRNKYKTFRTILKQGMKPSKLYGKILFEGDELAKELYDYNEQNNIYVNNALDVIELIDLFKRAEGDQ